MLKRLTNSMQFVEVVAVKMKHSYQQLKVFNRQVLLSQKQLPTVHQSMISMQKYLMKNFQLISLQVFCREIVLPFSLTDKLVLEKRTQ
jgi:hypothetical protein